MAVGQMPLFDKPKWRIGHSPSDFLGIPAFSFHEGFFLTTFFTSEWVNGNSHGTIKNFDLHRYGPMATPIFMANTIGEAKSWPNAQASKNYSRAKQQVNQLKINPSFKN
jgi:hypothetical protein